MLRGTWKTTAASTTTKKYRYFHRSSLSEHKYGFKIVSYKKIKIIMGKKTRQKMKSLIVRSTKHAVRF